MTRSGIQTAYRTCTFIVCTLLSTSAVGASGWDEFKLRCLGPMENINLLHPEDLPVDEAFQDIETSVTAYVFDGSDSRLLVGSDPVSCMLFPIDLGEDPFVWAEQAVADGRYDEIPQNMSHGPVILRSTEWREPKMEVLIHWYNSGEGQALSAIETDLES